MLLGPKGELDPCKKFYFSSLNFPLLLSPLSLLHQMAKSIRSKSMRKARAILHAQVFKPVEDARTARLSAKLHAIPASQSVPTTSTTETGDVMMVDTASYKAKTKKLSIAAQITQKIPRPGKNSKKNRRQAKDSLNDFNIYGLSSKEIRF